MSPKRAESTTVAPSMRAAKRHPPADSNDSFDEASQPSDTETRVKKKRKTASSRTGKNADLHRQLFQHGGGAKLVLEPCAPSGGRPHSVAYHRPLFFSEAKGLEHRQALLSWFDATSTSRAMPWRKSWIDPKLEPDALKLRQALERRAYEVWISEIMLQQTRVAVVIEYWNQWMDKWPTIQDLASADPEDVLAAWRGLGYYSRATRIHEAARRVVDDPAMNGLLPSLAASLEANVPGVGRYTAGAISAIVFGRAEPMVDGNVLRVLSRQLGIYGNIKSDKAVIDTIWAAADALAKTVATDSPEEDDPIEQDVSDRPGRWGQALMELGSTVCTPKPNCSACPITSSCRVYGEAKELEEANTTKTTPSVGDIEDLCTICEPFEEELENGEDAESKTLRESKATTNVPPTPTTAKQPRAKQLTLADFAFTGKSASKPAAAAQKKDKSEAQAERIANYARKFPIKTVKKAVREEETIVCAIRHSNGTYLVHRRPEKGLLAGLWEFPSKTIGAEEGKTSKQRTQIAKDHVGEILGTKDKSKLDYGGELGSVPWLFSHLKLTMHVHLFRLQGGDGVAATETRRWSQDVEGESMGTGMRKCWSLVKGEE